MRMLAIVAIAAALLGWPAHLRAMSVSEMTTAELEQSYDALLEDVRQIFGDSTVELASAAAAKLEAAYIRMPASVQSKLKEPHRRFLMLQADIAAESGQSSKSLTLLKQVVQEAQADTETSETFLCITEAHLAEGQVLCARGEFDAAVEEYGTAGSTCQTYARKWGPNNPTISIFIGTIACAAEAGHTTEALEAVLGLGMRLLEVQPPNERPFFRSALLSIAADANDNLDRPQESLASAQEADELAQQHKDELWHRDALQWDCDATVEYASALVNVGRTSESQELYVRAIDQLTSACARDGKSAGLKLRRAGATLLHAGVLSRLEKKSAALAEYNRAATLFEELAEIDPSNQSFRALLMETYVGLANVLTELGRTREADNWLSRAARVDATLIPQKSVSLAGTRYRLFKALGRNTEAEGYERFLREIAPGQLRE